MQVTARDKNGNPIAWECPKCHHMVRKTESN